MEPVGSQALTRVRRTAGAIGTTGYRAAATAAPLAFRGSLQPLPGDVVASLPEGERRTEGYIVITDTELRAADQHSATLADYVTTGGKTYEVRRVEHYPTILPHYEAIIVRIQEAL